MHTHTGDSTLKSVSSTKTDFIVLNQFSGLSLAEGFPLTGQAEGRGGEWPVRCRAFSFPAQIHPRWANGIFSVLDPVRFAGRKWKLLIASNKYLHDGKHVCTPSLRRASLLPFLQLMSSPLAKIPPRDVGYNRGNIISFELCPHLTGFQVCFAPCYLFSNRE